MCGWMVAGVLRSRCKVGNRFQEKTERFQQFFVLIGRTRLFIWYDLLRVKPWWIPDIHRDEMTRCVYVCVCLQWMSSLCALFSMTAQTDGVWPLVWSTEDPAVTCGRADVAERRPHSARIVRTLRIQKEIGREPRQTDRQTDTCCLCAFIHLLWRWEEVTVHWA